MVSSGEEFGEPRGIIAFSRNVDVVRGAGKGFSFPFRFLLGDPDVFLYCRRGGREKIVEQSGKWMFFDLQ